MKEMMTIILRMSLKYAKVDQGKHTAMMKIMMTIMMMTEKLGRGAQSPRTQKNMNPMMKMIIELVKIVQNQDIIMTTMMRILMMKKRIKRDTGSLKYVMILLRMMITMKTEIGLKSTINHAGMIIQQKNETEVKNEKKTEMCQMNRILMCTIWVWIKLTMRKMCPLEIK